MQRALATLQAIGTVLAPEAALESAVAGAGTREVTGSPTLGTIASLVAPLASPALLHGGAALAGTLGEQLEEAGGLLPLLERGETGLSEGTDVGAAARSVSRALGREAEAAGGLLPLPERGETRPRGEGEMAPVPEPAVATGPLWATPVETHAKAIAAVHNSENGATYTPRQGNLAGQPLNSVWIYPDRVETIPGKQVTADRLAAYMLKNEDLLRDPRLAVGTYYSPKIGETYLDIVVPHPDENLVAAFSRAYDQEGYYRLANGEFVDTGGSGRKIDPKYLYPAQGRLDHELERYRTGTLQSVLPEE